MQLLIAFGFVGLQWSVTEICHCSYKRVFNQMCISTSREECVCKGTLNRMAFGFYF